MPTSPRLLIIVADGEHARLVRPATDFTLHTVGRLDSNTAHLRSSELASDRPGASFHSQATAHHAVQPRRDPHDVAKQEFASAVAKWINEAAEREEFEQLVIAAPSHVLATLQDRLGRPARSKMLGSLAKDLTKAPDDKLQQHLSEWVRPVHRAR